MSSPRAVLTTADRDGEQDLLWECPGCEMPHGVPVTGPRAWTWNGGLEAPTLSPSLLVRFPWGDPPAERVCHSFVRDGRMEFLGDCTHQLANRAVEIPPWSD